MTDGGRILLTSSISARIGVYQHTLYAASKAAVSAMVLNLAPELAERGIAINAIAPGGTATDMAAEVGALHTPPALHDVPADAVIASLKPSAGWPNPTKSPLSQRFCCPRTPPTSPAPPSMPWRMDVIRLPAPAAPNRSTRELLPRPSPPRVTDRGPCARRRAPRLGCPANIDRGMVLISGPRSDGGIKALRFRQ